MCSPHLHSPSTTHLDTFPSDGTVANQSSQPGSPVTNNRGGTPCEPSVAQHVHHAIIKSYNDSIKHAIATKSIVMSVTSKSVAEDHTTERPGLAAATRGSSAEAEEQGSMCSVPRVAVDVCSAPSGPA